VNASGVSRVLRGSFRVTWMAALAVLVMGFVRVGTGPNGLVDTLGAVLVGLFMLSGVGAVGAVVVLGARALAARHRRALAAARASQPDYRH
jgi:hypothetical protein